MTNTQNYWMNRCDTEAADPIIIETKPEHDHEEELFALALVIGWIIAVAVCWFKSQPLNGGSWWMFGAGVAFFTFFVAAAWRDPQTH